jgi:hypothetical protein
VSATIMMLKGLLIPRYNVSKNFSSAEQPRDSALYPRTKTFCAWLTNGAACGAWAACFLAAPHPCRMCVTIHFHKRPLNPLLSSPHPHCPKL